MTKRTIFLLFIALAAVQLYVPASMILGRERVLAKGTLYKFRVAPVDPYDPFRGKYISLRFEANTFPIQNPDEWTTGQPIYVALTTDAAGYAAIANVLPEKPDEAIDYLHTSVEYVSPMEDSSLLYISYPFDRLYLEESKAPEAEATFFDSLSDTTKTTYALVHVLKGQGVLKDVEIDGVPIKEVVEQKN